MPVARLMIGNAALLTALGKGPVHGLDDVAAHADRATSARRRDRRSTDLGRAF
jgi:hypothetical protein